MKVRNKRCYKHRVSGVAIAFMATGWACAINVANAQQSVQMIGTFRMGPESSGSENDFTIKKDARLSGLQPEMEQALPIIVAAARNCGIKGPIPITSGNEPWGPHTEGSAHFLAPAGGALDFRTKHVPQAAADCWEKRLKEQLPADQFWIDLENEGEADEHLHVGLSKTVRAQLIASAR